ncbi:MAG: hypothetical protein ACLR4A_15030 [Christensenellales bacterium]
MKRRFGDFGERIHAIADRFAAGKQVRVADGDVARVLRDGNGARERQCDGEAGLLQRMNSIAPPPSSAADSENTRKTADA